MNRRARALVRVLATALVLACATSGSKNVPPPARRSADDVSLHVFASLQRDDVGAATADFSPSLSRNLDVRDARFVWEHLVAELGPLRSFRIAQRGRRQGLETRTIALSFERGEARGDVAVNPDTAEVEGLFVRPGSPSSADVARRPGSGEALPGGGRALEVVVGEAPWTLPATLTLPAGPGPFPAVVLVHGSGPQDRDETIGPNKPFRDLAEALAQHRIATLRYEKRTHAYRLPDPDRVTVEEEVITDAVAAVRLLQRRPEVRPGGVFVVGHSLGAQLAPEIARRAGPVAGIVMLAAPARPLPQIIVDQLRHLGTMPAAKLATLEAQAQRILAGRPAPGDGLLGVPASYFIDLIKRDALGTARSLDKPILLLRGDRDYQVTDEDQHLWQQALSGRPGFQALTLPGLNHLFIAGSGPPGPAEYGQPGHVHPSVPVRISAFVKQALAAQ